MKSMRQAGLRFLNWAATRLGWAVMVASLATSSSSQETVIHKFTGPDGTGPAGDLIFDAAGNLYGVAERGGMVTTSGDCASGCGTVYKLSPTSAGGWRKTILYQFTGGNNGYNPSAGLVFDGAGNLYGTAWFTSATNWPGGVVFMLSPAPTGFWKYSVLHNFGEGRDGSGPASRLIFDASGNLYGTTYAGGIYGYGTVFELSPSATGTWTETVLYEFGSYSGDGVFPVGDLILDSNGDLYGITGEGGTVTKDSYGIVFQLSPNQAGGWTETALHTFTGSNSSGGMYPNGGLIVDKSGNFYGVANSGGNLARCKGLGCGVVFKMDRSGNETVLYTFEARKDGAFPGLGLTMDAKGSLYGITWGDGLGGVIRARVYKLAADPSGGWTETVLHVFHGGTDGGSPSSRLIFTGSGRLLGTAAFGGILGDCNLNGQLGCGVVYEVKK